MSWVNLSDVFCTKEEYNELKSAQDSISQTCSTISEPQYITLYSDGDYAYCAYRKCGNLVSVVCDYLSCTANSTKTLGTLPTGYRPKKTILGCGYIRGISSSGQITINPTGQVQIYCTASSDGYFGGSVTFPLP